MTLCEECKRYGLSRTNQEVFPCALCGELRCEDHAIWVPSHELMRADDHIQNLKEIIQSEPIGGWYAFCGRPSHLPRGLPTRFGPEKSGGRIVRQLFDHEKKPGLEGIRMWETGIIEEGFEKEWEPDRFSPSCSFTATMTIIANKTAGGKISTEELNKIHMLAFQTLANKSRNFVSAPWEEFLKQLGVSPDGPMIMEYTCSRCAVIVCANRLAPFFDPKLLRRLIQSPEELEEHTL